VTSDKNATKTGLYLVERLETHTHKLADRCHLSKHSENLTHVGVATSVGDQINPCSLYWFQTYTGHAP